MNFFAEVAKLRAHLYKVEHLTYDKPDGTRRVNNSMFKYVKVDRGYVEDRENVEEHFGCPCCKNHFLDLQDLATHFEVHCQGLCTRELQALCSDPYSFIIAARARGEHSLSDPIYIPKGKRVYEFQGMSDDTDIDKWLDRPAFSINDMARLEPSAIVVIRENPQLSDEIRLQLNILANEEKSHSALLKHDSALKLLRSCLNLTSQNTYPQQIWSYTPPDDLNRTGQQFLKTVQHSLTHFASQCDRPNTFITSNHERTFFVDRIVPYFQYFSEQTGLVQFEWCEKYVTQKNKSPSTEFYEGTGSKTFADGIGYVDGSERVLIESSSGPLRKSLEHTMNDSMKQLQNLSEILHQERNRYSNARLSTLKRLKAFGFQIVKGTITMATVRYAENGRLLYEEPRHCQIPLTFLERFRWLYVFDMLAYFQEELLEQKEVYELLEEEDAGYVET